MRLIAFLFFAAFAFAGVMRYSQAAAPRAVSAPLPAPDASQVPMPLASLAASAPAPQVLRHKRRFAKAALRALKKAEVQQPAKPQKQMARLIKQARR